MYGETDSMVEESPPRSTNKLLNSPAEGKNLFIQQQHPRQSDIAGTIETLDETDDVTLNSKIKFDNLVSPTSTSVRTNEANFKPTSVLLLELERQEYEASKKSPNFTNNSQQQSKNNSFLLHDDEDSKDTTLNDHSTATSHHHQIDRVITNSRTDNHSSSITTTRLRRSFNNDFVRTSSIRDDQDITTTTSDDLTIDCSDFNSSSGSGRSLSIEETKHITIKEAKAVYNLQCQLCKENYRNPRVLPCLHSFCHSCLEDTIK